MSNIGYRQSRAAKIICHIKLLIFDRAYLITHERLLLIFQRRNRRFRRFQLFEVEVIECNIQTRRFISVNFLTKHLFTYGLVVSAPFLLNLSEPTLSQFVNVVFLRRTEAVQLVVIIILDEVGQTRDIHCFQTSIGTTQSVQSVLIGCCRLT